MAARRVFLTGATGFIGRRLARTVAERGDDLKCLVRSPARSRPLEELGAELIAGEITDAIALARGLGNADIAIHLAGVYDLGPGNVREMERINVAGTRCFLEEAARVGAPRLLHISSAIVFGPQDGTGSVGDDAWIGPYPSAYHRTKAEAHQAARRAQGRGLPVTIVCPAYVYGPGDDGPNGRFIRNLLRGRLPALLAEPATFSYVHVDDIVSGILALAEHDATSSTHILGGEAATLNAFAEQAAALAGRRAPRLRLPVWTVRATGMALDVVSRITRKRFSISRESVDATARHNWAPDYTATRRALDWQPRPLAEGLPPTVQWFISERKGDRRG
ncbi:MAG: NAD-dependent epimerase/dehydratase family protein [Gemmatimonadetes bacterium]|nr:NAD-dependent epimerase/dehydratase family protein [Gemmatimonadota bacterium]